MNSIRENCLRTLVLAILAGIFASCGGPGTITDETVALKDRLVAVGDNGFALRLSDYYTTLKKSWYLTKGGILDVKTAEFFRDSLILDSLAGFEANAVNLRSYPPHYIAYRERYLAAIERRFWKQEVYDKVGADSLEVVEFFNTRPDLFAVPDYVLVKHIFVNIDGLRNGKDSVVNRKKSLDELNSMSKSLIFEVSRKIDSGLPFDSAAKAYSMDQATAHTGGHLGWVKKGLYVHPFDSIAFGMRNNEISQPYKDKDGWHILHVERRIEEGVQPYDSNWYNIARQNLLQLRANELAAKIKDTMYENSVIVMNPSIMDTNVFLLEDTVWCAVVSGTDTILAYEMKRVEDSWRRTKSVSNTDSTMKMEMAEALAMRYRLQESARKLGIDTLPDTKSETSAIQHETAKAIAVAAENASELIPSDSAVNAYYLAHRKEFVPEKPLTIQHIVSTDSAQAEFIRDQALAGVDFMELARRYYPGEESLREELANLGEIGPKDVDSTFFKAALVTAVGSVSNPVKTGYGWHIIKVLKRVDEQPVGNARFKIMGILEREGKEKFAIEYKKNLFKKYHVSFPTRLRPVHLAPYDDRLKTIK